MKFEQFLFEAKAKKMSRAEIQKKLAELDKKISAGNASNALLSQRLWIYNMLRAGSFIRDRDRDEDDNNDFDADAGGDFGGDGGGE